MFTHLHNHSDFSLMDSLAQIKPLVSRAKELGMNALAITDHGNMFGVVSFYKECKKQGIHPVIGCEVYVASKDMTEKTKENRKNNHLVLLCRNEQGYRNLIRLVSDAYTDGYYYKPRTDKAQIRRYHDGLIALSGCLAGSVQRMLLEGRYEDAKEEAEEYRDIFGEDYYLEIQDHGMDDDVKLRPELIRLSKETGIPLVATNDTHYVLKEDADAQEVLLCMQTKSKINDSDRFRFNGTGYHLRSEEEMRNLFPDIPESIDITQSIVEKCQFEMEFGAYNIPAFEIPDTYKTTYDYFRDLCIKGFCQRYPEADRELKNRLIYEMETIRDMGYVEYFLIVQDFINWAKENNIAVGPGRGSAVGSVVSYSLKITDVDPVKYNLIFERFLNKERVSMPDIDTDFEPEQRYRVIDYVTKKYRHVCQISTFGTSQAKMAIRDVARVYNVPYAKADMLAKMIPEELGITIKEAMETNPDLEKAYTGDPEVRKIIDMSMKIEGVHRHASVHAAGVIISKKPIKEIVPLVMSKKGIATQYDMVQDEELGLLKMDFLGLRNLTVIKDTLQMIKERKGIKLELDSLGLDDPKVYETIAKGDTTGIFQFESKGITDFVKKLKPSCFEDIVAGVALYRPGPMDSIPQYLENKRNTGSIEYLHPKLEPILKNTYGCIVYQEQVMQIVRDLGGYSYGRSDIVRRAMSKKKASVMEEEKQNFIYGKLDENGKIEIQGCIRNGIPAETAEKIFDDMMSFAQYAFNKSHAAAYSVISYRTAWLKTYYPSEFMAALMTSVISSNPDHIPIFIKEARRMNVTEDEKRKIKILPPDIFESKPEFSVDKNGNIRMGLAAIRNVGTDLANAIEKADKTEFKRDYMKFVRVMKPALNTRALESLAKAGALNQITENSATAFRYAAQLMEYCQTEERRGPGKEQISLFDTNPEIEKITRIKIPTIPDFPFLERLENEKEMMRIYISGHPLDQYKNELAYTTISGKQISEYTKTQKDQLAAGHIESKKKVYTKKDHQPMMFLTLDDGKGVFEAVVFPEAYNNYAELLSSDDVKTIALYGDATLKKDSDDEGQFIVRQAAELRDIRAFVNHIISKPVKKEDPAPKEGYESFIKIRCRYLNDEIKDILRKCPGPDKVLLYVGSSDKPKIISYNKGVRKGNHLELLLKQSESVEAFRFPG